VYIREQKCYLCKEANLAAIETANALWGMSHGVIPETIFSKKQQQIFELRMLKWVPNISSAAL
jgi:hypothetical protein